MPMRSQLDSSVYGGYAKKDNKLGDILGAVQGIQSIIGNSRALSRQKIEEGRIDKKLKQEELLNTTFGKHLSGWTGDVPGDAANFETRTQMAMNEILQQDPTLYGEVADRIAKEMERSQTAQKSALGLEREKVGLDNDRITKENNQLALESSAIKHRLSQNELLTRAMSSVNTPEEYQQQYLFAVANLGNINLPDPRQNPNASQEFLQNKWQYLDKAKATEQQLTEQINALKMREQKAKTGTAEKENKWYDEKTQAEIDELGRKNTVPDKSQMDGIDPDTGKPYTQSQNKAAQYAVSMGRGIKNIDSLVEKGFDEASFNNQVMNVFRKKPKLSRFDFLNIAKTPEQRMYLQAQLDFMVPHLRDQSGAVISADEYTTEATQYFPRTGETQQEVEQKKNARIQEFVARRTIGGSRYNQILSDYDTEMNSRIKPAPAGGGGDSFDALWNSYGGK
jgi:hypothetical protein